MKRALTLLLCIMLFASALLTAFAGAVSGSDSTAVCTDSGIYLIGISEKNVHLECAAPRRYTVDIPTSYPVTAANIFGTTAIILCNDIPNEQLIVYTYDTVTDVPDSFIIRQRQVDSSCGFYWSGTDLYLRRASVPSVIERFSSGGKLLSSYDFKDANAEIVCGYRAGFCVLSSGTLYRNQGDRYTALDGEAVSSPAVFIAQDLLRDIRGNIYRVDDTGVSLVLHTSFSGYFAAAALSDGSIYAADQNIIYHYDINTGQRSDYYEADFAISALFYSGGFLYTVSASDNTVSRISPAQFTPYQEEIVPPSLFPISSVVYTVDSVRYHISRIPSPTTFAQFKGNMVYDGCQAQLFRDGKEVKSGNVGTAMTAVFSGEDTYIFELSVIGDITGEGNVNSRDVSELMDYFLGNIRFDGVYTEAADLSGDGRVDMVDLAMLCRTAG